MVCPLLFAVLPPRRQLLPPVGIYGRMRPQNSAKFCVCKITRPGPMSRVKNSPSPPHR